MTEKEKQKILYNRQVNYEIMYLMWQLYKGDRAGKEFEKQFGISRTTRYNITSQLQWEYDDEKEEVHMCECYEKAKRISFKVMARNTGISTSIFTGEILFEIDGLFDKKTLHKYLCFKQEEYKTEYRDEYKKAKEAIKTGLKEAKLTFEQHPDLWRLRNFCERKTSQEIDVMLDVVNQLTLLLNVHTMENLEQEQKDKLKLLIPRLKTFCGDNIRVQAYICRYLTELTQQLKRLELIEQSDDVLDNIKYLLELIDKMSGSNIKETPK